MRWGHIPAQAAGPTPDPAVGPTVWRSHHTPKIRRQRSQRTHNSLLQSSCAQTREHVVLWLLQWLRSDDPDSRATSLCSSIPLFLPVNSRSRGQQRPRFWNGRDCVITNRRVVRVCSDAMQAPNFQLQPTFYTDKRSRHEL